MEANREQRFLMGAIATTESACEADPMEPADEL
jgi:hypothetical protein